MNDDVKLFRLLLAMVGVVIAGGVLTRLILPWADHMFGIYDAWVNSLIF